MQAGSAVRCDSYRTRKAFGPAAPSADAHALVPGPVPHPPAGSHVSRVELDPSGAPATRTALSMRLLSDSLARQRPEQHRACGPFGVKRIPHSMHWRAEDI